MIKAAKLSQVRLSEGRMQSDIWIPDDLGNNPEVVMGYDSTTPEFDSEDREWFTSQASMRVAIYGRAIEEALEIWQEREPC